VMGMWIVIGNLCWIGLIVYDVFCFVFVYFIFCFLFLF